MRRLFHIAWAALLVFMAASAFVLPAEVGDPGKTVSRWGYLALMLPHAIFVPWLCTYGVSKVARRHLGLLNVPHKDYWFAEPRREASTAWMEAQHWPMGLSIVLVFALVHYSVAQPQLPGWPRLDGTAWTVITALLLVWFGLWAARIYRRFPKPPAEARPEKSRQPRRPYRS